MRTDYKDFIPSTALKEYRLINNANGTVSLEDVTVYEQAGDRLSAGTLNELSKNSVWPLTCTTTDTTHALTGLNGAEGLLTCAFTADADFADGNTFTVDGESYAIKMQDGSDAKAGLFVAGAKVQVLIDTEGQSVNFKAGGGKGGMKKFFFSAVSDMSTAYKETTFPYEGTPAYVLVHGDAHLNEKPSTYTEPYQVGVGAGFQAGNLFTSNTMGWSDSTSWYGGGYRLTFDYENHTITIGVKAGYYSSLSMYAYVRVSVELLTEEE